VLVDEVISGVCALATELTELELATAEVAPAPSVPVVSVKVTVWQRIRQGLAFGQGKKISPQ
jgi:hypothetical protein